MVASAASVAAGDDAGEPQFAPRLIPRQPRLGGLERISGPGVPRANAFTATMPQRWALAAWTPLRSLLGSAGQGPRTVGGRHARRSRAHPRRAAGRRDLPRRD